MQRGALIVASVCAVVYGAGDTRVLRTEHGVMLADRAALQRLHASHTRFVDITAGELRPIVQPAAAELAALYAAQMPDERDAAVRRAVAAVDSGRIAATVGHLSTAYATRYYRSASGAAAAEWVRSRAAAVARGAHASKSVSVQRVRHAGWPQCSVRVRVADAQGALGRTRVVLSAHLDSVNAADVHGAAPGADDDASGVAVQLEALRVLAASDAPLSRPVEVVFHAAEEGGLLGSQALARHYQAAGLSAAVLHVDMAGYVAPGRPRAVGLLVDNTDAAQNALVARLVGSYTDVGVRETRCGYACSDHAAWSSAGYAASALFEGDFADMSPHVHTPGDTLATLSPGHMASFAAVCVAFALHMTA